MPNAARARVAITFPLFKPGGAAIAAGPGGTGASGEAILGVAGKSCQSR